MSSQQKLINNQPIIFVLGLLLFIAAAILGWIKLRNGFNFTDEGWHMTESWRLTVGDHFLKDNSTGGIQLYTLINSFFLKVYPEIALLDFRRIQYLLTLISLIFLSFSLFKTNRIYWYQPIIFSLFAFTGLDPAGWASNLNYFTYPHLFLVFYLSFLISGLHQKKILYKRILFILAGISLWVISLCLLHLSVVAISPVLFYIIRHKMRFQYFTFSFEDLLWVIVPFILCWGLFIFTFKMLYIVNVIKSIKIYLAGSYHSPKNLVFNKLYIEESKHIIISMFYISIALLMIKKLRLSVAFIFLSILALFLFFVIDTSFFNIIEPYDHGFGQYSRQMFFASFLISFIIIFWVNIAWSFIKIKRWNMSLQTELTIMIMVPCTVLSVCISVFSTNKMLNTLYCSIPIMAAFTSFFLDIRNVKKYSLLIKFLILFIIIAPFYYTTAWADWKFNFFDTTPEEMSATIQDGFGKGIKTNKVYYRLYYWIKENAEKYSDNDDFMISYVVSPMTHMIAKRRPSLDHTFIFFGDYPQSFYRSEIKKMILKKKEPEIAFVFERWPILYPISLKEKKYNLPPKQFNFSEKPDDSISKYIKKNMSLVSEVQIFEDTTVKCFVSRDRGD